MTETPVTPSVPADRPRRSRHLTWIVPLVLSPLLFLGLWVALAIDESGNAPEALVDMLYVVLFFGSIVSFVVFVVAAVMVATGKPGPWKRRAQEDAARHGLTAEEYGVYKGDFGSLFLPVNSAGGLFTLSIIMSAMGVLVLVFFGLAVAQNSGAEPTVDGEPLSSVMWFAIALAFAFIPVSWGYYAKERRAQKLRVSRGLPRTLRR